MGKTEFEKMRSSQLYKFDDCEICLSAQRANKLCLHLSNMTMSDDDYRDVLEELIPNIAKTSTINPPFHCDHGSGITIGHHSFINYDCIMLDGGAINIGNYCKIGPRCQFLTPQHPIDFTDRMEPVETCLPITIGDNCWLGGGVVVCPGVTIGPRCIIAAGSVVIRDIPADSLAAGNPAVVKKSLG